jgi:uncharacterized membrane protein YidH (DUF202 family)
MRPLGIIGVLLIVFGIVVLALRGISYTKDRDAVRVGPLEVAAEKKGFIPPAVGLVAVVAGVVILVAARRQA